MPFSIRTDLAMEARELHPSLPGVTEEKEEHDGVSISRIALTQDEAARRLGKQKGRYITLDAPELTNRPRKRAGCRPGQPRHHTRFPGPARC